MTSVGFPFPASSIFGFRGIYGASALESTRSTRLHTVCSVSTKGLTTALKLTDVSVQQDVHEFMDVLFKRIEAELKGTAHSALITDLFQGEQIDYVHCLTCGTDSRRTDHFRDLKLVVPLTEPATGVPVKLTTNNYGMGGPWHTPLFDEVGGEGVVDGGGVEGEGVGGFSGGGDGGVIGGGDSGRGVGGCGKGGARPYEALGTLSNNQTAILKQFNNVLTCPRTRRLWPRYSQTGARYHDAHLISRLAAALSAEKAVRDEAAESRPSVWVDDDGEDDPPDMSAKKQKA